MHGSAGYDVGDAAVLSVTGRRRYRRGTVAAVISGGYAVLVLAVAVFVLLAGGLAAVWLVLLTLPSALLVQFLPAEGSLYVVFLTLGGLAQASLLWVGLRGRRLS